MKVGPPNYALQRTRRIRRAAELCVRPHNNQLQRMPIARLLRNCLLAFLVALAAPAFSQDIAREFFPPTSGKGAPVVVISGLSGTSRYREHAAKLASLGYFAVLIDGKDVLFRTGDAMDPAGQGNLRKVLTQ